MLRELLNIMHASRFPVFTRPYELNIVGLRAHSTTPNRFDDEIHVFYIDDKRKWRHYVFKATTDPGTFWLNNPIEPQGTAILAPGRYENAYQLGLHRGQYLALVQRGPVTIIRDYDRDAVLDFFNGRQDTGYYGINIHHASVSAKTKGVNKDSAGCQVFEDINDYNFFIGLCVRHAKLYGNHFTYTLIDFRYIKRFYLRMGVYAVGAAAAGLGAYWLISKLRNRKKITTQEKVDENSLREQL